MLKPNYALDFQPICTFFPWGEGIEDTELQPFLDFSQFCPLSPWERVRERAANRQVCFLAIVGLTTSSTLSLQHPLKPQQCQP